jgi:hypothetical protein
MRARWICALVVVVTAVSADAGNVLATSQTRGVTTTILGKSLFDGIDVNAKTIPADVSGAGPVFGAVDVGQGAVHAFTGTSSDSGSGALVPPGADMSGCSNRAVSSNFREPQFDGTPPVLPLQQLPADAVSVPTWSGSFTTDGTTYPFTMVGTDPAAGSITTHVPVEIIPLSLHFPGSGCVLADDNMAANLEASPLFAPTALASGDTQWLDNYQRSNFWSTVSTVSPDYHLLLDPSVAPTVTLHVPASQGLTVFDPSTNRFQGVVGDDWFQHQIVSLLNSLHVSPTTLAVFVPYNTVVTDANPNDCLAPPYCGYFTGFHNAVLSNAKPHAINTYTWASYLDDGTRVPPPFDLGTEVLSHELVEWAADPFAQSDRSKGRVTDLLNTTPGWIWPFNSGPAICGNYLEVADVLEGWPFLLYVNQIGSSTNYLLANAAFLSWFARQSPSTGIDGLYDLGGAFNTYSTAC